MPVTRNRESMKLVVVESAPISVAQCVVSLIAVVVVSNACASTTARVLECSSPKTRVTLSMLSAPQDKQRSTNVVADAECSVETRCISSLYNLLALELTIRTVQCN